MSDQPTEYPRFYGFTPKKRHFIWRPPDEVEAPIADPAASDATSIAVLSEAEPSRRADVAVEPQPEPDRTPTELQPVIDAIVVSPEVHQPEYSPEPAELPAGADVVGTTTDATASAITNVASLYTQTGLPSPRQVELGRSDEPWRSDRPAADAIRAPATPKTELIAGADVVGTTTDATALAITNVASPPVNSGHQLSRNSRASNKSPARRKTNADQPVSFLAKHEAKCMICRSKWREEIDELFVNWHNVSSIGREYHVPRRVIYRHAHATGLFPIRDRNVRCALGLIIHRAENAPDVSADSVIRAVRTLAHINDAGEWTNPPTHVIVSSGMALRSNNSVASPPQLIDTPCQTNKALNP